MTGEIETMDSMPMSPPDSESTIGGKTHSEETKAKISTSMMGERNHMYGKTQTKESNAKRSVTLTGRVISKETRAKISAAWTPERRAKHSAAVTGNTHSETTKAKIGAARMGKTVSEETRTKISAARIGKYTGENHPNWRGGISFEPYGMEFNSELKRRIRKRDDYTCQECHLTEEQLGRALDVHHIDYDKKNNNLENLISLCRPCHSQTNFSREDWTEYFRTRVPSFSEI